MAGFGCVFSSNKGLQEMYRLNPKNKTKNKSEFNSGWTGTIESSFESPHLSVIAICSSMAEPVLAFQFPEMDVLLETEGKKRHSDEQMSQTPEWRQCRSKT